MDTTQIKNVETSGTVYSGSASTENVPSQVMSTAVTAIEATDYLYYSWNDTEATDDIFVYIHFAELETLKGNQTRKFNISLNDVAYFDEPVSPLYHTTTTYFMRCYNTSTSLTGWHRVRFVIILNNMIFCNQNNASTIYKKKKLSQKKKKYVLVNPSRPF